MTGYFPFHIGLQVRCSVVLKIICQLIMFMLTSHILTPTVDTPQKHHGLLSIPSIK